jgi:hypothetical protein
LSAEGLKEMRAESREWMADTHSSPWCGWCAPLYMGTGTPEPGLQPLNLAIVSLGQALLCKIRQRT